MFKLEFYVPVEYAEKVKNAVFAAGGGRIGNYDCCSWETLGSGQFRPSYDANPFIGEAGNLEKTPELKVEMVCDDNLIDFVITALIDAHPYETPAYQFWKVGK
jgi:hypothetical protein